jgi:hypothetical protein
MTDLRRQLKQAIRERDEARRERDQAIRERDEARCELKEAKLQGRRLCDSMVTMILASSEEYRDYERRNRGGKPDLQRIRQVAEFRKVHTVKQTAAKFNIQPKSVDQLLRRARENGYI